MRAIVCEMCGSHELVKQNGLFVCQSCGTKYTLEEAKKLVIEVNVDISGSTVKVDQADELRNLYQLARRARDTDNYDNGAKYYEMILIKEPTSWEANFYNIYFKAIGSKMGELEDAAPKVQKSIQTTFELIRDYVSESTKQNEAIKEVFQRTEKLIDLVFGSLKSGEGLNLAAVSALNPVLSIRVQVNDSLLSVFKDNDDIMKDAGLFILKTRIDGNPDLASEYLDIVRKYDPGYTPPKLPEPPKETNNKSSGCYVATAVYGSYDCPEVWTLRRYRDYHLDVTWYGRLFIKCYYAISPTLVKKFGNKRWFKVIWKCILDRKVARLKYAGVKDTPYKDKY